MDQPLTRVLLVDDDEDDFILTQDMLADIGHGRFQLDWVSTFDEAIERIEHDEHDVCLVDYFMGDHDGLELLRHAAAQGCTAPIILLTGVGGYEVDVEAMKSGAADFLVKDQMTPHILERSIRYAIERRRAQDALEASEEQYRVIFEASADAILIFDMNGVIIEANPAAGAVYGYSRRKMIGLTAKDIVHPDYHHEFEEFMRQVKIAGEYHWESVDIAKGGVEFNVEVRGSLFHYKGHDRLLTVVRDTTERKHAESVLRESEQKYRSVVDNIGTGVALISPAMKILALNKQMRTWFPDATSSGWHICHEVFNDPPRESACPGCPVALTLQDGKVHESVIETSVSNNVVHYRMISSPVLNAEGKILGAIEMAEDITERRRAEEAQARLATAFEQ
ncbi:MAG: PAS domain S-box protein, partial [Planctomycetes bacterium]|nr:PAS domain S-box protein [Planctomycetota bacterium]